MSILACYGHATEAVDDKKPLDWVENIESAQSAAALALATKDVAEAIKIFNQEILELPTIFESSKVFEKKDAAFEEFFTRYVDKPEELESKFEFVKTIIPEIIARFSAKGWIIEPLKSLVLTVCDHGDAYGRYKAEDDRVTICVDNIESQEKIRAVLIHELVHRYHHQQLLPIKEPVDSGIYNLLWLEGIATAGTAYIDPACTENRFTDPRFHEWSQKGIVFTDWINDFIEDAKSYIPGFKDNYTFMGAPSEDHPAVINEKLRRNWFGYNPVAETPNSRGYLLGDVVISQFLKTQPWEEILKMHGKDLETLIEVTLKAIQQTHQPNLATTETEVESGKCKGNSRSSIY